MLNKLPELGQFVRALQDDGEEWGQPYQTKGKVYEIVGKHNMGNPYFIDDNNDLSYIDEEVLDLYELVEDESSLNVKNYAETQLTGVEVDASNFIEYRTEFSFNFKMNGRGKDVLKTIDSLQEDIIKLLNDK